MPFVKKFAVLMVTFHDYLAREQIPFSADELDCSNACLTDLDGINQFRKLRELVLPENKITSLDLRQCRLLEVCKCSVYFYDSISKNLPVRSNPVRTLLVRDLKRLRTLYCANANLHEIDLTGCVSLELLMINTNQLTSLTLNNHPHLETLVCSYNQLKEIRIENCPNIEIIRCNDNRLPESNIQEIKQQCPKLRVLWKNRQNPKSPAGRPVLRSGKLTAKQIMKRHQEKTTKKRYEVSVTEGHYQRFEDLEAITGLSRSDLVEWILDQMQEDESLF